ncbi:hypothetical protein F6X50_11190 [Dickeya dianthicola]|uniref:hypothetical protein n=1 Tax=Dickeya dianthicola TaxID=204039 RepID=UPI0013711835|nr:hypothetical protein [Dickeya dianthicola]MCI4235890.1 hypothetical protein [Dickeya dianthicola]MCI4253863.1 hypothetical protein [Dickeya dianthicola]MZG20910.1 hypothetical protein [Dickeya dianthicola]MZI89653.1 hypothetical protein [Dickeya dianthicola]
MGFPLLNDLLRHNIVDKGVPLIKRSIADEIRAEKSARWFGCINRKLNRQDGLFHLARFINDYCRFFYIFSLIIFSSSRKTDELLLSVMASVDVPNYQ